jgi:hypothetical protein
MLGVGNDEEDSIRGVVIDVMNGRGLVLVIMKIL